MTWFDTVNSLPLETGSHDLFNRLLSSYAQFEITTSSGCWNITGQGSFPLTLVRLDMDRVLTGKVGVRREGERKEGTVCVLFVKNHQFVYFAMLHFYKNVLN